MQSDQLNDTTDVVEMNCNNPLVLEAFLHYVYGAHVKLVPPTPSHTNNHTSTCQTGLGNGLPGTGSTSSLDPETTPDTSFNVSVDENDLTGVYDQFFARSYSDEFADVEVNLRVEPPAFCDLLKLSTSSSKKIHVCVIITLPNLLICIF